MQPISYDRHRFPPEVIRHAIWLYARFTLSYRDVEELLAERGFELSYETVRRWVLKFGPAFACNLRRLLPRPADTWHLDEMVVSICGRRTYLWRAVDSEGEILDLLVNALDDFTMSLGTNRRGESNLSMTAAMAVGSTPHQRDEATPRASLVTKMKSEARACPRLSDWSRAY